MFFDFQNEFTVLFFYRDVDGVQIIGVGLGDAYNPDHLLAIVGGVSHRVITVGGSAYEGFELDSSVEKELEDQICNVMGGTGELNVIEKSFICRCLHRPYSGFFKK